MEYITNLYQKGFSKWRGHFSLYSRITGWWCSLCTLRHYTSSHVLAGSQCCCASRLFIILCCVCVCIYRVERRLRSAVPRDDVLYLSVAGYITTITERACSILIFKKTFHFQPGLIFDSFCNCPTTYFFSTHQSHISDLWMIYHLLLTQKCKTHKWNYLFRDSVLAWVEARWLMKY